MVQPVKFAPPMIRWSIFASRSIGWPLKFMRTSVRTQPVGSPFWRTAAGEIMARPLAICSTIQASRPAMFTGTSSAPFGPTSRSAEA